MRRNTLEPSPAAGGGEALLDVGSGFNDEAIKAV
jgi:hypothetical protein